MAKFSTIPREFHPSYGYGSDEVYHDHKVNLSTRESRRFLKRCTDLTKRFAQRRAFRSHMVAIKRGLS